ncbi:MAG TPA: SufD family Fe-S cluster assembly protein [Candidatus Limnocylindrales bacterium]|nr:SufD family Fe-S cluster assembly protein [Candidatus Limnocylindrales bacterium]
MRAATAVAESLLPLDRDTVERLHARRGEPDWLLETRLAALARYTDTSWPSGQEEEWRRFPLTGLPRGPLLPAADRLHGTVYGLEDEAAQAGVVFSRLSAAARDHPELVRAALGEGAGIPSHAAPRALGETLWSAGSTFVHVPRGVQVRSPLHVRKDWPAGPELVAARTILVAEEGSSVTFVEELASEGGGPGRVAIPLLDVRAGPGARVTVVRIQRLAPDVWDLGSQRYLSERDSTLRSFNVVVGSGRSKIGVSSEMRGDGASVKLFGLVAAGDEQRIDVNSHQRVDGRASESDLLYLSALYDAAKAVYYGVIRVEPTSSGTGSYQECRNMLLSDRAGADPIPVLEILTNDVARCGHGATAGAIDEAELFYVMSRGLDRRESERLLVRGFFQRVVNQLEDEHVRQRVLAALVPRIGRMAELEIDGPVAEPVGEPGRV